MRHLIKLSMMIGAVLIGIFSLGGLRTAHAFEADVKYKSGDFGYSLNSDGTCDLEYYYGDGGTVKVPATLDGHAVYQVSQGCFAKSLGTYSMSLNKTIKRLILPEGLERMGRNAVYCSKLEYISLPASLRFVENASLSVHGTTTEFYVDPANQYFCSYKKSLFSKDMTILYKGYLTDEDYTVPENVTEIKYEAFMDCKTLVNLVLPSSVKNVEISAFQDCDALKTVTVNGNNVNFEVYSFSNDDNLREFRYAGNKLCFRYGVFWYDSNFTDFYFGGTKEEFAECTVDMDQNEPLESARFHFVPKTQISSVENSKDGLTVTWGKLDDAGGYRIYRKENYEDSWKLCKEISGNATTSWTDGNVVEGKAYYYIVRATTGSDNSFLSGYVAPKKEEKYMRLCAPAITKIVNTVQGAHVYWEKRSGATGYDVYRSLTETGGYTKLISTKSTNYTDKSAVSGKQYYYKVKCTSQYGKSQASAAGAMTFVDTPDITTRVNSVGGIRIYWNKINGATGYAIYRKGDGANDKWARVKTVTGNSTFVWTDSSTKPASCNGAIYHYTVRALAGKDKNILSGCRSTGRTMVRLNKPVIYSMEKKSAGTVLGTWSRNDKATGYEVRFMVGTEVYKTFVYGDNKIVKKTISGLPTGKTYKIQVRSYYKTKSAGTYYSSWSDAVNVKL